MPVLQLQLQLQLSARNLRRLCSLAHGRITPYQFCKGLRGAISYHLREDLEEGFHTLIQSASSPFQQQPTPTGHHVCIVRLAIRHNCSSITDEERDVLHDLLWQVRNSSLLSSLPLLMCCTSCPERFCTGTEVFCAVAVPMCGAGYCCRP